MEQVVLPGGLAWVIVGAVATAMFGGIATFWRMSNEFSSFKKWLQGIEKRVDDNHKMLREDNEREVARIDKHQDRQDKHIDNLWRHLHGNT